MAAAPIFFSSSATSGSVSPFCSAPSSFSKSAAVFTSFKSSQVFNQKAGASRGLFEMLTKWDDGENAADEIPEAEDPDELQLGGSSGGAAAGGSISHLATAISAQLEKVTEAHRKEIMQLRGQLMREISIEREARAVAQQQLLELTAQTAARVEAIYSGRRMKRQRTPSSATLLDAVADDHTLSNSAPPFRRLATLLDAEDRFQDGTAEPVVERPFDGRSRVTRPRQRHTGTAGVAATAGPAQGILEGLYRSIQPATASAGANPRDAHLAA